MARRDFTIEIDGATAAHADACTDGARFMVLPAGEHRAEHTSARIRLHFPDGDSVAAPRGESASEAPASEVTVAEVEERMRRLGESSTLPPHLELDAPDGSPLCSVRPGQPSTDRAPARFTVLEPDGTELCTLSRHRPHRPHRSYWHIAFPDGRPPLTGHKGTLPGWCAFALLSPFWLLLFLLSLLVGLLTFDDSLGISVWGKPSRTVWRTRDGAARRPALIYRYQQTSYRWDDDRLDHRVAYAQAAVHHLAALRG